MSPRSMVPLTAAALLLFGAGMVSPEFSGPFWHAGLFWIAVVLAVLGLDAAAQFLGSRPAALRVSGRGFSAGADTSGRRHMALVVVWLAGRVSEPVWKGRATGVQLVMLCFAVTLLVLIAMCIVAVARPALEFTPEGLARRLWRTSTVAPWDGGVVVHRGYYLELRLPRGRVWVPLSALWPDRDFLVFAIFEYAGNPQRRAGIGTAVEHARLKTLYAERNAATAAGVTSTATL